MVNPGGTGRPALVISARFAPLPPSVSFIVRSPSALPLPKKYTYFFVVDLPERGDVAADFLAVLAAGLPALRSAAARGRAGADFLFAVFFLAMSESLPARLHAAPS